MNEATLTGEPFSPRETRGRRRARGKPFPWMARLRVRATVAGAERRLDAVLARVRAAQATPSHLEREADRIVAWFLPAVLGIAAATFWFLDPRAPAGRRVFSTRSPSCSSPARARMGLATPIGVWSALADLAGRGIVANTSDLVERLAAVKLAVFDKTGTLSDGRMESWTARASRASRAKLCSAKSPRSRPPATIPSRARFANSPRPDARRTRV